MYLIFVTRKHSSTGRIVLELKDPACNFPFIRMPSNSVFLKEHPPYSYSFSPATNKKVPTLFTQSYISCWDGQAVQQTSMSKAALKSKPLEGVNF